MLWSMYITLHTALSPTFKLIFTITTSTSNNVLDCLECNIVLEINNFMKLIIVSDYLNVAVRISKLVKLTDSLLLNSGII